MMTILYTVGNKLYVNITNRCPCACTFCIRNNGDGAYGSDSLWLEREPTVEEILRGFDKLDLDSFTELVFCGYGEPMERADAVAEVMAAIRKKSSIPARINTNGLSDLINGRETAHLLRDFDTVSISLNAPTAEEYNEVSRPSLENAFDAILKFAEDCKKYVPKVIFSVVDVITKEQTERCQALADSMNIPLRVRKYDS